MRIQRRRRSCDAFGDFAGVGFAFDHAGAGDEEERVGAAEAEGVSGDFAGHRHAEFHEDSTQVLVLRSGGRRDGHLSRVRWLDGEVGTSVEVESKPPPFERRKGWATLERKAKTRTFPKAKGCAARKWTRERTWNGRRAKAERSHGRHDRRYAVAWSNADHSRAMRPSADAHSLRVRGWRR